MDGEVGSFTLMAVDEVAATVRRGQAFKYNCNLVIIDYLVRHGVLGPDHPDYIRIVSGLRAPLRDRRRAPAVNRASRCGRWPAGRRSGRAPSARL